MSGWRRIFPGEEDISNIIGTCVCCEKSGRMGAILHNYLNEDPITMCKECFQMSSDTQELPEDVEEHQIGLEILENEPFMLAPERAICLLESLRDLSVEIEEGSDLDSIIRHMMLHPNPDLTYEATKTLLNYSEFGLEVSQNIADLNHSSGKTPFMIRKAIKEHSS